MANNFVQDGKIIEFTAGAAYDSGDPVLIGDIFGVVQNDVESGEKGEAEIEKVYALPKAAVTITAGQKLYWDASAEKITNVRAANKFVGFATEAAGSSATTVKIKLMNVVYAPKNNYAATAGPGVGDDVDDGYAGGSIWIDTTAKKIYVCFDASAGSADWNELAQE